MLISLQAALLRMRYSRDIGAEVNLWQSGSDCLETLFSALGGCGAVQSNLRNYDFNDVLEMLGDLCEMALITSGSDDESLKAGKRHRKQQLHRKYLGEDGTVSDACRFTVPSDADLTRL